ncbi:hypothetical protein ACFFX0_05450 [Citricoccus parietis]|uniref:Uncharacterized protein n=1 Tax=Citricoccus parietis TaxID=592307 RepID=A0ABV5FVF5_9MICC
MGPGGGGGPSTPWSRTVTTPPRRFRPPSRPVPSASAPPGSAWPAWAPPPCCRSSSSGSPGRWPCWPTPCTTWVTWPPRSR